MYGTSKKLHQFLGAINTIELDDFIRKFDRYVVATRSITIYTFHGMEGYIPTFRSQPMDDYHEFCDAHEVGIEEWHRTSHQITFPSLRVG
jgi:hypothetical protein